MTRLLAVRLQAIGDATSSFPYFAHLRRCYPHYRIDFATMAPVAEAARGMNFFERVYEVRAGSHRLTKLLGVLPCALRILPRGYDVLLDFQDNAVSRCLTRACRAHVRGRMEKFERRHALARFVDAVQSLGLDPDGRLYPELPDMAPLTSSDFRTPGLGASKLRELGVDPGSILVVLNPAGAFPSRNWPLEHYVAVATHLRRVLGDDVQFLVLGVAKLHAAAAALAEALGAGLHDLVGRTTLLEAMAVMQHVDLAVSEDSALMHLAWTAGRPTIGIMGSSPSYWGRPIGRRSLNLDSSNLDCAWCLDATCPLGHYRCLMQYSPERVAAEALTLLGGG